jgi:hypothetical protein
MRRAPLVPQRRALRLLGVVLAAALCGPLALAAVALSSTGAGDATPPGAGGQQASAPSPADTAAFAILRRAATPADATQPRTPVQFSGASGANPSLARRAAGLGEAAAWVVPGSGSVCLISESQNGLEGGAACMPDEAADAGQLVQLASSEAAPGQVLLSGLVPDGVSSVTVGLADGSRSVLAVHEDVYAAELRGSVREVQFTSRRGAVVLQTGAADSATAGQRPPSGAFARPTAVSQTARPVRRIRRAGRSGGLGLG